MTAISFRHLEVEAHRSVRRDERLGAWHYAAAGIAVAVAIIVTGDAWRDMFEYGWKDEESGHVLLAPIAAAWIALVRRASLKRCPRRGTWWGPPIAAIGLGLWASGWNYDVQVMWHGGALMFALGAAVSVLGMEVLRRMAPAAVALLLLVPVPGRVRMAVSKPLQVLTALLTEQVAQVLGMDVTRTGYVLEINHHAVTVAEACNGMRMAFTLLLACYVFAFTTPLHNGVRFLVLLASPLVSLAANLIRLIPTLWVAGNMSPEASEIMHVAGGWSMLFVSFFALTAIVKLLAWLTVPVAPRGLRGD
jgi:exosortase